MRIIQINSVGKYYLYTVFTKLRFTRIINIIFLVQFLHYNLVQYAFIQSIFLFSQLFWEIPSGVLSDLFKRKTVIVIGLAILFTSPFLMISTISASKSVGFIILITAFFMEGLGNALLSGSDDALFYEAIRFEGKEELFGKIRGNSQLINAISLGIATFIGGILYSFNIIFPYLLQSLMLIFPVIIILSMKNVQSKETILDQEQTLKNTLAVFIDMTKYSNILFIFLLSTVIVSMINAVFSLLPDYISKIGFSSSANGGIFMIYSFVGGIIATQSYRIIKYSFRSLVTIISVILVLGIILQIQSNKYVFLIGIGLLYIVEDIIDPIIMQILNKWVEDKSRATFISGLSFLTSLVTMIINPLIGSIIMKYGTISMLVSSSIITILVIIIFYVVILRAGVTKDE